MGKEMQDLIQQSFNCKPGHMDFLSACRAEFAGKLCITIQADMQNTSVV